LDDGNITLFTSEMARLGCRVKPLRENDDYLLTLYDQFFDNQIESTFQLTRVIIDKATYLRATYGCNTPDAIHLAAAIIHDCDIFLTNDQRLDFSKEIKVEIL
jgi:predicted nucleic acid-binding protein